jgi:hypothetical protein
VAKGKQDGLTYKKRVIGSLIATSNREGGCPMSDTPEQAIAAIKAGDKNTGGQLLNQVLQTDPQNETAWLWMTAVVGSDEERRKILEHVLSINPDNEIAQNSLAKLKPPVSPATDIQVNPYPTPPQQFETPLQPAHKAEENEAVRKCPYCAETTKAEAIVCRFCGRDLQTSQSLSTAANVVQFTGSTSPLLDQRIKELVESGWEVVFRAPTEAKLKKPKRLSFLTLIFSLINSFIFFGISMILFFGNTANVVYFFIAQYIFNFFTFITFIGITGHLAKKEKVVLYTEKQLMMEKNNPVKKNANFFFLWCDSSNVNLIDYWDSCCFC